MICTRLDITQEVGVVSRFMNNPRKGHWKALNGFLGIGEVLKINPLILEVLIFACKDIWNQIWQVILIMEGVLRGIYLP